MKDFAEVIKSLGLGLSRLLRYSYGGFLLLVLACVINSAATEKILKPLPWEVTALAAVVVGAGLYGVHRGLVIPIHHLIFCGVMRAWESIRGVADERSDSPTHWLRHIRVPRFYRIWAYSTLRRSTFFTDQEKEQLDVAHAESGLVVMTFEGFLAATVYARFYQSSVPWRALLVITVVLLIASYFSPFEQHSLECMRFRRRRTAVEQTLRNAGIPLTPSNQQLEQIGATPRVGWWRSRSRTLLVLCGAVFGAPFLIWLWIALGDQTARRNVFALREGSMESAVGLVGSFLLGVVASTIAWVVSEYLARPSLNIVADENRSQGQLPNNPPHEFYHVRVANLPAKWPLPGRRPAWACAATIEVFRQDGSPATDGVIFGRWASQPEPLLPVVSQGQVGNVLDPARIMQARRIDVHGHSSEPMSIALKFEGEADCYIFTNESYVFPKWQNPAWRLPPGRYRLRVAVYYERGRKHGDFDLRNDGPTREEVRLLPWPG